MPRLSHGEALLSGAAKDLRMNWELTASLWKDRARADFERTYIDELLPAVKSAVGAIENANKLLGEAIRQCS